MIVLRISTLTAHSQDLSDVEKNNIIIILSGKIDSLNLVLDDLKDRHSVCRSEMINCFKDMNIIEDLSNDLKQKIKGAEMQLQAAKDNYNLLVEENHKLDKKVRFWQSYGVMLTAISVTVLTLVIVL